VVAAGFVDQPGAIEDVVASDRLHAEFGQDALVAWRVDDVTFSEGGVSKKYEPSSQR